MKKNNFGDVEEKIMNPVPGLTYQHYKGGLYWCVALGRNEATGEDTVVYRSTATLETWTRTLTNWNEPIDGKPRFKLTACYYVASRLENAPMVKDFHTMMATHGWETTYDWTIEGSVQGNPDRIADVAAAELAGVIDADVVIVLLPGGRGTHVELGAALAMEKPTFIYAEDKGLLAFDGRTSAFYHHPRAVHVDRCADIPQLALDAITNVHLGHKGLRAETIAKALAYDQISPSYKALLKGRDETSLKLQELRAQLHAFTSAEPR